MRLRAEGSEGAITVMASMLLVATLVATSLAVDVGRVAYVSRDQQGVTDRAAIDTMFDLQDHGETTLEGLENRARQVVEDETFGRNADSTSTGLDRALTGLVLGTTVDDDFVGICGTVPAWVDQDPPMPTCTSVDTSGAHSVDDVSAVEVFTSSSVPYIFALGAEESERDVNKRARAGFGDPRGGVSAASTAVSLDDGLARRLVSRLLGANVDLDLVGWNGLANTSITMRELAAELGAGSVGEVLQTEVTVAELASAMLTVLQNNGADADVLATVAEIDALDESHTLDPVELGEVIVVDPGSEDSALDATVDAASLLFATGQAALIEGALADGEHFATVGIEVSGLGTVELQLVEAPQVAWGQPGKKSDGTWRTQATTAQTRLQVDLPLDVASTTVAGAGGYSAGLFRDRIDAIATCGQALDEASDSVGTIRSDVEDAIDAYEEAAGLLGVAVDTIVATIDSLLGTLDTLVATAGCLLTPNATRDDIKDDLHALVDEYEKLVVEVAGAFETAENTVPADPVLLIELASGAVALDTITCADPIRAGTVVEGDQGRVRLTSSSAVAANPDDPAATTVTLLDLDLGRFGSVMATLSGDVALGSFSDTHEFVAPFPSDPVAYSADDLALGSVLSLLTLDVDADVMGLPADPAVDRAVNATTSVLQDVFADVDGLLDRALEVMGVDLGVVEARVLDATCEGPPRMLANP